MDHSSILLAYSEYPAVLAALAPRIRFSLHKEFRDGEIRLSLPKEFRAAELGGDASENGDFQSEKQRLQVYKFFQGLGDPSGGGLRIVSGEHVRIVSGEHREIIGGRCVRKWRFSKRESALLPLLPCASPFFKERIGSFSRSFHFIFLMKNRGDDATENVNFQRRKQRLQGAQKFQAEF